MKRKVPWLEVGLGLFMALLVALLSIPVTMYFSERWYDALEVRPDFTGNHYNTLMLAMIFVQPFVAFAINALALSIYCPVVYVSRQKDRPIRRVPMTFLGLAIALLLSLMSDGFGMPAEIYIATLLPIVILTGPLIYLQLTSLEDRRKQEDERRDLPSLTGVDSQ